MKNLITIILVFVYSNSFAQQKKGQELIDSLLIVLPNMKQDTMLVNAYNTLSGKYSEFDYEKTIGFAKKAIALADKLNWDKGVSVGYRQYGVGCAATSNYEEALKSYDKAIRIAMRINDKQLLGSIYSSKGLLYFDMSNYPESLKFSSMALKISEDLDDQTAIARTLSNIGIVYNKLSDFKKAINFYEAARKINEKIGNKNYLAANFANLGGTYGDLNILNKALFYYKKALALSIETGNKSTEMIMRSNVGYYLMNEKKYNDALIYLNESLATAREIGSKDMIAANLSFIGQTNMMMAKLQTPPNPEKLEIAVEYINQAIIVNRLASNLYRLSGDLLGLSEMQELQGDFKNALSTYKEANVYKDSIYNSDNKETIKNLEDQRTIEIKEKQLQINKLQLENTEKQKWYYIIGLGFLTIIGILFYRQSRNRKRNSNRLEILNGKLQSVNEALDLANKTKTLFFSIISHDLRSPITSLIHFLQIQKDIPELLSESDRQRHQNQTLITTENLLQSMEDLLLWSKGQMDNFKPKIESVAVNALFDEMYKFFSAHEVIAFRFENPDNIQLQTDQNFIKTIMRNLTNNAIKAVHEVDAPIIVWKAYSENGKNYLSISDNGSGGTQEEFRALYDETLVVGIKTGLGLHLIRDLAKAINCKITVDLKPTATSFLLRFE